MLLTTACLASVAWGAPAFAVDHSPGRFTGGGKFISTTGAPVTFGYEMHCNVADLPNRLEVNWGGNAFHLTTMTRVACSDRANIDPAPPVAPSDVLNADGTGKLNNKAGASADWRLIDKGEPGVIDHIQITIRDATGTVVMQTETGDGAVLIGGNVQAHRQTP